MNLNKKQSGITLIEVLITILVLAIGLLGMAALQLKTLNVSQESYSRSQAVILVENVADKMRANSVFIHSDEVGNNTYTDNSVATTGNGWCKNLSLTRCEGNCTKVQLLQNDIIDSCGALTSTGIPDAKLGVRCNDLVSTDTDTCSSGSSHLIYLAWSPEKKQDVDGSDTYTEPANSRCRTDIGLPSTETCVLVELVP